VGNVRNPARKKAALQDLPGRRAGEVVENVIGTRHLERCKLRPTISIQILLGWHSRIRAQPDEGLAHFPDAQYDEFITNVAGYDEAGNPTPGTPGRPVDVADYRRIQNTPKWTLSGTLDYSTPLGGGELSALTTLSYRSKTHQFETPSPFLDQPGYALWDANLIWTSAGDRYSIGLHAKNITDKQYITSGYQFLTVNPVTGDPLLTEAGALRPSLGREGIATAFYGNPRQLFISLGINF
jgi:iron complex outermembrane receptor protein